MTPEQAPSSPDATRRSVLAGAAALTLVAPTGAQAQAPTTAVPAPRVKGPKVWLDLDQQELDDAYDQSKYAPNLRIVLGRYAAASEETRRRLGPPRRLSYGARPIEGADLFATSKAGAPINVFIHGGAWRAGLAKDYEFPAEMVVNAGAHFIAIDFENVVETKGDLSPMVAQCRAALAWIHANAASFGGDPDRIFLSGHSSGAHLAGVLLTTAWKRDHGVPDDVVKGAVLISGLYDLKPARLSARSSYVAFTDEIEAAFSSERHIDMIRTPIVLAHGTLETPEFQRQTRDFAAALQRASKPVELVVAPGYNHFELLETMANPYGIVGRQVLRQMGL